MSVWYDDDAGLAFVWAPGIDATHEYRGKYSVPGTHRVRTEKSALDDGRPATLVRRFNAVVDDFGTLVEVPA